MLGKGDFEKEEVPITDSLIEETLKHKFPECTMVTIAHRITSVLDSDKVLLLDKG